MNISDRIQALRRSKGVTQEQLADAVGVSRQAVSKWEAEQAAPDLERIVAIAEFFDVTTDYLLRGIEPAPPAQKRPPASARTMCIIATALDAAGVIIGGGLWLEYQNWLCVAVMLVFQLAAVTVWLLTKGGRPRWFWAVNAWFVSLLPSALASELVWLVIQHLAGILYFKGIVLSLPNNLANDLAWAIPFTIWLITGAVVTLLTLRKKRG